MKHTLNKILAILLTLIMILNFAPFAAYAEEKDNPPDSGSYPEKILLRDAKSVNSVILQLTGENSLVAYKGQYNYYLLLLDNSNNIYAYGQLTKSQEIELTKIYEFAGNPLIWIVRMNKDWQATINNYDALTHQGVDDTIETSGTVKDGLVFSWSANSGTDITISVTKAYPSVSYYDVNDNPVSISDGYNYYFVGDKDSILVWYAPIVFAGNKGTISSYLDFDNDSQLTNDPTYNQVTIVRTQSTETNIGALFKNNWYNPQNNFEKITNGILGDYRYSAVADGYYEYEAKEIPAYAIDVIKNDAAAVSGNYYLYVTYTDSDNKDYYAVVQVDLNNREISITKKITEFKHNDSDKHSFENGDASSITIQFVKAENEYFVNTNGEQPTINTEANGLEILTVGKYIGLFKLDSIESQNATTKRGRVSLTKTTPYTATLSVYKKNETSIIVDESVNTIDNDDNYWYLLAELTKKGDSNKHYTAKKVVVSQGSGDFTFDEPFDNQYYYTPEDTIKLTLEMTHNANPDLNTLIWNSQTYEDGSAIQIESSPVNGKIIGINSSDGIITIGPPTVAKITIQYIDETSINNLGTLLTRNDGKYFLVAEMATGVQGDETAYYVAEITKEQNQVCNITVFSSKNADHYLTGTKKYSSHVIFVPTSVSANPSADEVRNALLSNDNTTRNKYISYMDGDAVEAARLSTGIGSVMSPETSVVFSRINPIQVKASIDDNTYLFSDNHYYILAEMIDQDENKKTVSYYKLINIDAIKDGNQTAPVSIEYFEDKAGSGRHFYTEEQTVNLYLVRSTDSVLTIQKAVDSDDALLFEKSQISEDYTISVSEANNVKVLNLNYSEPATSGSEHKVTVHFYAKDYLLENYVSKFTPADSETYYIVSSLADLSNEDVRIAYSVTPITIAAENEGILSVTIPAEYKTFDSNGNDAGGTVYYDPSVHKLTTRLYHKSETVTTDTDYNSAVNGSDSIDGFDFMDNVMSEDGLSSNIYLHEAYNKAYSINIRINPSNETITFDDNTWLFVRLNHKSSDTHECFITRINAKTPVNGEYIFPIANTDWRTTNYEEIKDNNVVVGYNFTGNETTEIYVVKKTDQKPSYDDVTKKQNCTRYEENTLYDAFVISYEAERKTVEKEDGGNYTATMIDYVDFTKVNASQDYDFMSILDGGVYYGITAHFFNQQGHIQSNFAANTYYGGNIVEPDLAGNGGMIVAASAIPLADNYVIEIGGSHVEGSQTLVYLGNEGTRETLIRNVAQRDWVHLIQDTPDNLSNSIVEPIIQHGDRISEELLQHNPTFTVTDRYIDTLGFDENATIYIDADDIANWIAKEDDGLYITKHPNQTIIFNFDSTTNVTLGQYHVRYSTSDNYIESHSPTGKGTVNEFMDDLAKHIVFNLASIKHATVETTIGIILAPRDDSEVVIKGTSAGWIISDGEVRNEGAEWHSVYSDLPSVEDTNLSIVKTVDGITPTTNQKFTFTLYYLDQNGTWQQIGDSINNINSSVAFNKINISDKTEGKDNGWIVYRIHEEPSVATGTEGTYVNDTRDVYAFVKFIKFTTSVKTIQVALTPIYFMTAGTNEPGEYFAPTGDHAFNKSANTLTEAFNNATSDDAGSIKIKLVAKAIFVNNQKKDGLNIHKTVIGAGDEDDVFTFKVDLWDIAGLETGTKTVTYVLTKPARREKQI